MIKRKWYPAIFIISVLICILTGCGQKNEWIKVPEDALTRLFTVSDYSLAHVNDRNEYEKALENTYEEYFTSEAFSSFVADRLAAKYVSLAEKEGVLISVKDVELTKTKEEDNNIFCDFQINLVLKHTKSGKETSASQNGQLTVTSKDKKSQISRLYDVPDNLFQ
ncbi:MAG: hypothetical protein K0Q85_785 [Caproiciproducens sp.]|nr:hypothetical protein [Caproiciproducens sp.]